MQSFGGLNYCPAASQFTPSPVRQQSSTSVPIPKPLSTSKHPFFVRQISENIRVCQGCRGSLHSVEGSVPNPPFDMAIARLEKRPFLTKQLEHGAPHREKLVHIITCMCRVFRREIQALYHIP